MDDNDINKLRLAKAKDRILEQNKPNSFSPFDSENIVYTLERNYERLMISFDENGINARDFTAFQLEVALKKNEDDIKKIKDESK